MPLPDDLKNYRAEEDSFQLIDPQTAGALVWAGLVAVAILERFGIL